MNDQSSTPVTPDAAQAVIDLLTEVQMRRPQIERALAHAQGTHTFNDIVWMVMQGRVRWWCLPNSFLLTEVIEYPQQKHFHVFLAGGNLNEIKGTQPFLVDAARLAGCSAITLTGRRGWIKALLDLGWNEKATTVAFPIPTE